MQPDLDFTTKETLMASLILLFLTGIVILFVKLENRTKEHREDLKLFDTQSKKDAKELLDVLNKFYLSIEESKITDNEVKRKIDDAINVLNDLKSKIDARH